MKLAILSLAGLLCVTAVKAQNYDESRVPAYTLPDALTTFSGKPVRTVRDWERVRRPEILKSFEQNVYGAMPATFDKIAFTTVNEDAQAMGGKATLKEVRIDVTNNGHTVPIRLVLFLPKAARPVPAFLLINNRPEKNTDPTRAEKSEFWPAEMVIDSGYAIAAFQVGDLAPDNKDRYAEGILQQLYPPMLKDSAGMKAIGAWAWGAMRVMDYFSQEPAIDARRVGVVGHSRGGKTSLWAAAQDKRFALCFSNCSGNSGAALSRRQFGERIARINKVFPHWFCDNYKLFNDRENDLPVDQHLLIALSAPRPVYVTNATKDLWADPTGTFLALKNAGKVYTLMGLRPVLPDNPPPMNTPWLQSPLAYHNREGEHNMTAYDWEQFLKFAGWHYRNGYRRP
ncbi:alpha/beta hydrolase family protein [Chitinophaga lutea]